MSRINLAGVDILPFIVAAAVIAVLYAISCLEY
jgi:hypothetical protein